MSNVLVAESTLYDIADAIRERKGVSTTYKPGSMADAIRSIEVKVMIVDLGLISSLPHTANVPGVKTDMVCLKADVGTPSAMASDWTVSTDTANYITISGTINGSTTLTLYLLKGD